MSAKGGFASFPLVGSITSLGPEDAQMRKEEFRRMYPDAQIKVFRRSVRAGGVIEDIWVVVARKR